MLELASPPEFAKCSSPTRGPRAPGPGDFAIGDDVDARNFTFTDWSFEA